MKAFGATDFAYPYSADPAERREQIWSNLHKGLLLENSQTFIPWTADYQLIAEYKSEMTEENGRTTWCLGEQEIINGLSCRIMISKWAYQSMSDSIGRIEDDLGADNEGNKRFLNRIDHFTNLLGQPTTSDLTKFGTFDIGVVKWTRDNVGISLVGVEVFNCRYSLRIGLPEQ